MTQIHPADSDLHKVWFRRAVERALAKGQHGKAHFTGHDAVFDRLKQYARDKVAMTKDECAKVEHADRQLA